MSDTSLKFARILTQRYAQMTAEERVRIASDMYETARKIVESSLPVGLPPRERRMEYLRRMYGTELPAAALNAFADWQETRLATPAP